jgi:hypothetical protein
VHWIKQSIYFWRNQLWKEAEQTNPADGSQPPLIWGKLRGRCESAGINWHRVGDERAPHERSS